MGHRRQLAFVLLAVLFAAASAPAQESAAIGADDAATRQYDFANGLYVRGEAFWGQAAEQYRVFLRDYPKDARCDEALFRLGECSRKDGKLDEALKTFDAYARRFPSGANAHRAALRRGQVLHELGRHDEAITAFQKLLKSKAAPELKEAARYRLAMALLDGERTDEAIKTLNAITDTAGDRFRPYALYQLAVTHTARGENDAAIKRFRELAASSAELAPEALFRIGEIEFKRGRYVKAAAAYRDVADKHAASDYAGAATYGLVQSLVRAKRYEEAIAALEKFKALVPEPVRPQTDYLVANAHYELEQYETALGIYRRVQRAVPKTKFAAKADLKAAWCLYFAKQFQPLAEAGTTFLNEHPRHADADTMHYLVGEALLQLKRPQDALLHYETIVKDYPDSKVLVEAEFKIGWCLFLNEDYEKARQRFLDFAGTRPDDARAAEAVARAAECSIKLAKMADAAADYQRLLRDYPDSPLAEGARFQLGLAYVALDEQEKAVAVFADFVERYPKSVHLSDAYYWIGSQQQKAGELDEAIASLSRAVETATEDRFVERARYKLAVIHYDKDEFDKAAAIILDMLTKNAAADVPAATHLWAAGYLLENDRFDEAKALYEGFLAKHPEGPTREEAHFGLGECLMHDEQWEAALGQYRQAIAFGKSLKLLAELRASVCLHKLGKDDEAIALLAELIKSENPAIDSKALYWLGTLYLARAKKEQDATTAVKLFDEARLHFLRVEILYANAEERPECLLRVGECLAAAGKTGEANAQYRKVIQEYPDSAWAAEARRRLGTPDEETSD